MKLNLKMKNIKILSKFIILAFFFYEVNCDITIIGPNELSLLFDKKPIKMAFNKIGKSTYDYYIRGELFLQGDPLACQNLDKFFPIKSHQSQENFKILIVKEGGCPRIQKARNAQYAGYNMILIVNDDDTDIEKIGISDDGSGNNIYIPLVIISKKDGEKLINYIQNMRNNNGTSNKVIVEINFIENNNSNNNSNMIDFKFFFSSSELRAYLLMINIVQYIYQLKNDVLFTPIYVVHPSTFLNEDNIINSKNCVSKGKYCYFPKETTIIKDGKQIILENLRQKCIYNISIKNKNINNYFNYIRTFYNQCLIKEKIPDFSDKCAIKSLSYLGYSVEEVDRCMADSFRVTQMADNIYFDKENKILKNEYDEILNYKLTTFPAVIINNKPLKGVIKENKIINTICNILKNRNGLCYILKRREKYERKKIYFFLTLVCVIFISNILTFLLCRKFIGRRINEGIYDSGLDIDGKIKNIVGNYFSLREINNDYIKMSNNSSSRDFEKEKEKIKVKDVEIS